MNKMWFGKNYVSEPEYIALMAKQAQTFTTEWEAAGGKSEGHSYNGHIFVNFTPYCDSIGIQTTTAWKLPESSGSKWVVFNSHGDNWFQNVEDAVNFVKQIPKCVEYRR